MHSRREHAANEAEIVSILVNKYASLHMLLL